MAILNAGPHAIDLATPCVMGIVNVTADSFFDGGRLDANAAIAHARRMLDEGARIVDIGGESTRPGATPVDAEEELRRVVPVVAVLARDGACVSIDTMKPAVMRAALDAGGGVPLHGGSLGCGERAVDEPLRLRVGEVEAGVGHDETSVPSNSRDIQFVVETAQGWFERNGVGVGTLVQTEKGTLRETFFGRPVGVGR